MPRLPRLRGKEVVQILKNHGFETVRIRGSHHSMKHADGRYTVVPIHSGEIVGIGLLLKIMKDADLSKEDLVE